MSVLAHHSETARELEAFWQSGLAKFVSTQEQVGRTQQQAQKNWLGCMQAMAEAGSAFASRLFTARSPSDTFAAWQEYTTRLLSVTIENYWQLVSDGQQLGDLETRFLPAPEDADN